MKMALRLASHALVLVAGLAAGFYFGFAADQGRANAYELAETGYYFAYMDMQMSEGTDAAREEAIHGFLTLVEKRKGQKSILFPEKAIAQDMAFANVRLAALAQKRGATQEAKQYLDRAASFCPQTGWRECSVEKIVSVVQRLDKQGIFGTKNPK